MFGKGKGERQHQVNNSNKNKIYKNVKRVKNSVKNPKKVKCRK